MAEITKKKISLVVVGAGDRVRYASSVIEILSPDNLALQSAEFNDTSIVEFVKMPEFSAMLMGDIGFSVENYLAQNFDIRADVLKASHHGSKNSSGEAFLRAVQPKVAVIQSGAGNRYGHPTADALRRLDSAGARTFRNDQNGTIRVVAADRKLKIFTER